jgi:hypothetical protein
MMSPERRAEIDVDPSTGISVELGEAAPDARTDHTFVARHAVASPTDALILAVSTRQGRYWTGRFEGGYPSPKSLTLVTNGPKPNQLVVVNRGAGFVVSVDDPEDSLDLNVSPIVGLVVDADAGAVLVADFTNVTSVGPAGELWTAEVSWDGVELDGVEGDTLRGRGWDAPRGLWVPFEVDVPSGRVLKGPTPRP